MVISKQFKVHNYTVTEITQRQKIQKLPIFPAVYVPPRSDHVMLRVTAENPSVPSQTLQGVYISPTDKRPDLDLTESPTGQPKNGSKRRDSRSCTGPKS